MCKGLLLGSCISAQDLRSASRYEHNDNESEFKMGTMSFALHNIHINMQRPWRSKSSLLDHNTDKKNQIIGSTP